MVEPTVSEITTTATKGAMPQQDTFTKWFWGWVSVSSKEETYPTSTADSNQEWPCKGEGQGQESQA